MSCDFFGMQENIATTWISEGDTCIWLHVKWSEHTKNIVDYKYFSLIYSNFTLFQTKEWIAMLNGRRDIVNTWK